MGNDEYAETKAMRTLRTAYTILRQLPEKTQVISLNMTPPNDGDPVLHMLTDRDALDRFAALYGCEATTQRVKGGVNYDIEHVTVVYEGVAIRTCDLVPRTNNE